MIKFIQGKAKIGVFFVFMGTASVFPSSQPSYKETLQGISDRFVELEMPFPSIRLQTKKGQGPVIFPDLKHSDGHVFSKQTVFVPEFFYAVIGKGLNAQSVLAGPLCPCILVAVRHEGYDRAVVFHSNGASGATGIVDTIKKEFGYSIDSKKLIFKFFSRAFSEDVRKKCGWLPGEQEYNFRCVLLNIMSTLGVPLDYTKQACFYSCHSKPETQDTFLGIDRVLFVDKDLCLRSVSIFNEQVFGPIYSSDNCKKYFDHTFYNSVVHFYKRGLFKDEQGKPMNQEVIEDLINAKKLPFFRIPDNQAGLAWLPLIASGCVKNLDQLEALQQKTFVVTALGAELLEKYKPKV